MAEVYTGSKPGRPNILLLLTAGALVGALGLAWVQVQGTRALGDPVAIADTPLIVRPPLGWVMSDNPRLFGKPIRKQIWGREIWTAERAVEFHYNDYFTQYTLMFRLAAARTGLPARIAEWNGIQYVANRQVVDHGGRRIVGQKVHRWVSTPRGEQIGVEYTPLAELSHGDLYLLDEICEDIRLDETRPKFTPQELLEGAGFSATVSDDWNVMGPDDLGGPGVWFQQSGDDQPLWAIGVFRRHLRSNHNPLEWLIAEAQQTGVGFDHPREQSRQDGVYVGVLFSADATHNASVIASLWIVAQSPNEVAIMYVLTDPVNLSEANQAASELAATLEFVAPYPG